MFVKRCLFFVARKTRVFKFKRRHYQLSFALMVYVYVSYHAVHGQNGLLQWWEERQQFGKPSVELEMLFDELDVWQERNEILENGPNEFLEYLVKKNFLLRPNEVYIVDF